MIGRAARAGRGSGDVEPQKPTQVTYHVPHRIREGYGMQSSVLAEAAASGVRLVISVDTGIRAFAEAIEARALALDLIVTDHHLPAPPSAIGGVATQIPDCLAVINPAQPDCPYPNKDLCGAAVAFKLAHALLDAAAPLTPDYAAFRTRTRNVLIPSFLKLVAIATIADSVPLSGENRTIAALGLAALANPVQPGLRALMQLARLPLDRAPTATEVGFRIAPRINAAGRMDIASDVVELLLTRDPAHAQRLAVKLDGLNQARRDSEARALETIDEELAALLARPGSGNTYPADCLILDHPDWHRGVLGILASRVVDRTGRPALVLTHADGDAHGSGRSIPGFHLLDAITAADAADPAAPLFNRFGGHAHAVGFSLASERLPLLRARMKYYASTHLTPALLVPRLDYDAELSLAEITPGADGLGRASCALRHRQPRAGLPHSLRYSRRAHPHHPGKHIALQLMQRGPLDESDPPQFPPSAGAAMPLAGLRAAIGSRSPRAPSSTFSTVCGTTPAPTPVRNSAVSNSRLAGLRPASAPQ